MKIENIEIEDAADASYFIRKFFNDELKNIKMNQLEQLVLTAYRMGKNKAAEAGSESSVSDPPSEPDNIPANPFNIGDRVKTLEDIEIGHTGLFIDSNTEIIINSVNGDMVSFLYESDEDGEMIEVSVLFNKLEKINGE